MKKIYLTSLFVLLVATGILILCFRYFQVNGLPNTILASTEKPDHEIVFETLADLDNDGKKERIVLSEVVGYEDPSRVYSRILIFKGNELVFNSKDVGLKML